MSIPAKSIQALVTLVCVSTLGGCVSTPPTPEPVDASAFERVRQTAPFLTCLILNGPMYQQGGSNKIDVECTVTGTLLPTGECLTAGHLLQRPTKSGERIGLVIEGRGVESTILERELIGADDFARLSVTFKKPPDLIAERIASPERQGVRFDPAFDVRAGQTLFAVGFTKGSGAVEMPMVGMDLTILPLAAMTGGREGPIVLDEPRAVRLSGMSGGPILAFDARTGELVVIGIITYSQDSFRYQRRLLYGLRLPASSFGPSRR